MTRAILILIAHEISRYLSDDSICTLDISRTWNRFYSSRLSKRLYLSRVLSYPSAQTIASARVRGLRAFPGRWQKIHPTDFLRLRALVLHPQFFIHHDYLVLAIRMGIFPILPHSSPILGGLFSNLSHLTHRSNKSIKMVYFERDNYAGITLLIVVMTRNNHALGRI